MFVNLFINGLTLGVDACTAPYMRNCSGLARTQYVDNFIGISQDRNIAAQSVDDAASQLRSVGLPLHPVEVTTGGDTLGWTFSN